jgi:hypothetical protein
MQRTPYEASRLAHRVRLVCVELAGIGGAACDLKMYQVSTKLFHLSTHLFALERELLDLPPIPDQSPTQEDLLYGSNELPF